MSVVMAARNEPITLPNAALDCSPHEIFRQYRAITPLIKREGGAGYVAIRAADVLNLITDPRTRQVETELGEARGVKDGPLYDFYKHTMLMTNGPDHRRRRAPLSRTFAFKLMTEMRPRIRAVAEQLIDQHFAKGEMDFLNDFCSVVPARIICEIMGIPAADIPRFTVLVYTVARAFTPTFTREEVPELQEAARQLIEYVDELLVSRRASPREDFLTAFVQAADTEQNLSPLETLIQIVTVIVAGSDTTRTAMAIQTALLLQHREQWNAVCGGSALIPGAVAECLRYEPAVGSFPRFTLEDIEIDGYLLPARALVSICTLSAMRDPALYSNPDSFDITRADHPDRHLVFGGGVHRCLGEVLARAELEESLTALAARLPQLHLVGEPPKVMGYGGIRRLTGMRVGWTLT
jgi:cytochrome P450 family 103